MLLNLNWREVRKQGKGPSKQKFLDDENLKVMEELEKEVKIEVPTRENKPIRWSSKGMTWINQSLNQDNKTSECLSTLSKLSRKLKHLKSAIPPIYMTGPKMTNELQKIFQTLLLNQIIQIFWLFFLIKFQSIMHFIFMLLVWKEKAAEWNYMLFLMESPGMVESEMKDFFNTSSIECVNDFLSQWMC